MRAQNVLIKSTILLEILLASAIALAGPQAEQQAVAEPSLGQLARQVTAERARQHLSNVPLFTNDNLPSSQEGRLGEIGSSGEAGRSQARLLAARQDAVENRKLQKLRYDLSQAQQELETHRRELTVLEEELGQNNIQYYSNPNQTLLEEYSRQDINALTQKIYDKKQQITDDQQTADDLQGELKSLEASWGWLAAGQANNNQPPAPPPIDAKPGSPAYWQAKLAQARDQLAKGKEEAKLAEDELNLLKIQQIRTIDPNLQAGLASAVSAKQQEVSTAEDAVRDAQNNLEHIEANMQRETRN